MGLYFSLGKGSITFTSLAKGACGAGLKKIKEHSLSYNLKNLSPRKGM